ncbi:MAG: glycosyltransferase family A protein [Myxococcota bacterium]|nr:glycosyltransferase family A protein [Myxococcota bacterium]
MGLSTAWLAAKRDRSIRQAVKAEEICLTTGPQNVFIQPMDSLCKNDDAYSVVIPTYNRVHTLRRALDSVFAQTRAAQRVIVVDDGSTDESATMMETHYPTVTLIRQENQGVSAARNRGLSMVDTPWIAFLDSDDEWLPQKMARQFAALNEQPHFAFCHTEEIWIRNGVRVNQMKKHQKSGGDVFRRSLQLCCISPSSALIHRRLFDVYGCFDEGLPACEDYDLWLRICAHEPVLFIDQPMIIKYGGHDDQLSRLHWGMDRFRIKALESLLETGQLNPVQTQQTHRVLMAKLKVLLNGARKRGNQEVLSLYGEKHTLWDGFLESMDEI